MSLDESFLYKQMQLDELRQIYEELPEFLEEVLLVPIMNSVPFVFCLVSDMLIWLYNCFNRIIIGIWNTNINWGHLGGVWFT